MLCFPEYIGFINFLFKNKMYLTVIAIKYLLFWLLRWRSMDLSSCCCSHWCCCYWCCWKGTRDLAPTAGSQQYLVPARPQTLLSNISYGVSHECRKTPRVSSAGINQLWTCWDRYGNTNGKMVRQALKLNSMAKINSHRNLELLPAWIWRILYIYPIRPERWNSWIFSL